MENSVEKYWNKHTVQTSMFVDSTESRKYINIIDRMYPFYLDFFELYKDHSDEILLDYGCGPGNDLIGFLLYSNCKKIVGADISNLALSQAHGRLTLHNADITGDITDGHGISLLKINEEESKINTVDNFYDFIQSSGVIHHTSNPTFEMSELYRVLKPSKKLNVMMYHRNSLWVKFAIPYDQLMGTNYVIPSNKMSELKNLPPEVVFEKLADCGAPIAFLSDDNDFVKLANDIGFKGGFYNAAFCLFDLKACLYIDKAKNNKLLPIDTLNFINKISFINKDVLNININKKMTKINIKENKLYEIVIESPNNLTNIKIINATNNCNNTTIDLNISNRYSGKLFTLKDNITVISSPSINICLTEIYPIYDNKYFPGINAIYKFRK